MSGRRNVIYCAFTTMSNRAYNAALFDKFTHVSKIGQKMKMILSACASHMTPLWSVPPDSGPTNTSVLQACDIGSS